MTSILHYAAVVLIWGSTWLAITFQLGRVPPALSVAYRFFLAAILAYLYLVIRKQTYPLKRRDHFWVALQGLTLFGVNYVTIYYSELYISSGLVSVLFSTIVPMNILNSRLFFRKPISKRVVAGALLGLIGISLVFQNEFRSLGGSRNILIGFVMVLGSTYIASLGNMVATRNQKAGIPILTSNTIGMLYGAIFTFVFAAFTGPVVFEPTVKYFGSMLYLAVFGSILAFFYYITLVGKIGAERASYAAVAFPIVALSLSTVFEGYKWSVYALGGVGLILVGNVLVLRKK